MDRQQMSEMLSTMREVLQEDFITYATDGYRLEEDFETGEARITCRVFDAQSNEQLFVVEGAGAGFVDALFEGLKSRLAADYPSLNSITFHSFNVKGDMSTRERQGSDAVGTVELGVLSSEEVHFQFDASSRSVARATIESVLAAVGYFVNSEKTFIRVHNILEHYRRENRHELVTKYQLLLGQMVQNTSYTETIQQIKQSELG